MENTLDQPWIQPWFREVMRRDSAWQERFEKTAADFYNRMFNKEQNMRKLTTPDLQHVVRSLPHDVRDLLAENHLYVAGGFIREVVAGQAPSDIDLCGPTKGRLISAATALSEFRESAKVHTTDNALTVLCPPRLPVQFITRWLFDKPEALVESFDFTICQAAVWYDKQLNAWRSGCSEAFYTDLAARRLVYTHPQRMEDCGGSAMRMRKFLARGFNIQADSMAGVLARLFKGVTDPQNMNEFELTRVLSGRLREVDPLLIVDGLEPVDEHEKINGE